MENTNNNTAHNTARLHPLVAAAAVSLIVVSAFGVAALTGVLPKSGASTTEHSVFSPGASATTAAPGGISFMVPAQVPAPAAAAPAVVSAPAVAPKPVARPVVKKVARPKVQARAPEWTPEPPREEIVRGQQPVVQAQAPAYAPQYAPQYSPPYSPPYSPQPVAQARCYDCGEVAAVNAIEQKGEGSWIGPVAGGVGGAILGKQMGKGSGNTIMTILGAAGGAYAGHKVEQKVRTVTRWDVVVRMEDGSTRTVSATEQPLWRIGDRVRVNNGTLEPQRS